MLNVVQYVFACVRVLSLTLVASTRGVLNCSTALHCTFSVLQLSGSTEASRKVPLVVAAFSVDQPIGRLQTGLLTHLDIQMSRSQ